MHERFARRIEQGLLDLQAACIRQKHNPILIAQRLGRLMGPTAGPRAASVPTFRLHRMVRRGWIGQRRGLAGLGGPQ